MKDAKFQLRKDQSVGIFWSGGLDSTYIIEQCLQSSILPRLFYVEIQNNDKKVLAERKAMKSCIEYWKRKYDVELQYTDLMSINVPTRGLELLNGFELLYVQMPIWQLATQFVTRCDIICFGYCENFEDISIVNSMFEGFSSNREKSHYNPILAFPILDVTKEQMVREMDIDLIHMTHSCEWPKIKYLNETEYTVEICGHCPACERRSSLKIEDKSYPELTIDSDILSMYSQMGNPLELNNQENEVFEIC